MIAVLGASGQLGGLVAQGLADRGVRACALTRRQVKVPLPARYADLRDGGSLEAALGDVERLFLVTPHGPDQDLLEQAAIRAAVRAGVDRIVKISGGAASLGPNGPTPTAVAHWRSERAIEQTGLGFTFLRPSFLTQNVVERFAELVQAFGVLPSPFGTAPIAMVDARDVAACAIEALLADVADDRAWQLTGPAAVSTADIARGLGVRHLTIPSGLAARALRRRGADDFEVAHATRMAAYFASGADGATTDHVRRLTSRSPRPATELLHERAADFAPRTPLARLLTRSPTGG